jgi:hypothetical protein
VRIKFNIKINWNLILRDIIKNMWLN